MFQGIPFAPISDVRELPRAHSMGRPPPHTHTQRAVWLARCLTKGWPQHCAFSLVTSIAGCLQQWFEDIESEGVLAELPRAMGREMLHSYPLFLSLCSSPRALWEARRRDFSIRHPVHPQSVLGWVCRVPLPSLGRLLPCHLINEAAFCLKYYSPL